MKKLVMAAAMAALVASQPARAEGDSLKIGLLFAYSGPYAAAGQQIDQAIELFFRKNGRTVAGRPVEIIRRDTTGPAPDVSRRLAQELVTRDKVEMFTGLDFTPNAVSVGAVSTEARVPVVSMNAGSTVFLPKAPFGARVSFTLSQVSSPLGHWASKNGVKKVYTVVSDYSPGIEAEAAFQKTFRQNGGEVAGAVRVPLRSPDFASYLQRIKGVKPDAVFVFVPAGEQAPTFVKAFREAGLADAGIKLLATGDMTEETLIDTLGDAGIGLITSFHYSTAHDTPENQAFVRELEGLSGGKIRANFTSVAAYDALAAIYKVAEAQQGRIDADRTIELLKGWKHASMRGPIEINADRDIVQTVYIRRVERRGGRLENVEIDSYPNVAPAGLP